MNNNKDIASISEEQISPTPDSDSPTGVLIPTNVLDAIAEFDRMLPVALKLKLQTDLIGDYQLGLVLWLKNNWCFAEPNNLVKDLIAHLTEANVTPHPDNLSALLIEIYKKYLENPFFDLEENLTDVDFFKCIAARFSRIMNCDRANLWLSDLEKMELVTKIDLSGKTQDIRIASDVGFAGKVLKSGKTLNIPFDLYNYHSNPNSVFLLNRDDLQTIKDLDLKIEYRTCSVLVVPIIRPIHELDKIMVGVMQLINKEKPGIFETYNSENYPQSPECWQANFTESDELLVTKLNQQLIPLMDARLSS